MKKILLSLLFLGCLGRLYSAELAPDQIADLSSVQDQVFGENDLLEILPSQRPDISLIQSILNSEKNQAETVESLDDVLEFWMQSSVKQEVKDAILMAVEKMKEKKTSDEEIIRFVKAVMQEKSGKKHTKLKIAAGVVVGALIIAGIFCAYRLYLDERLLSGFEQLRDKKIVLAKGFEANLAKLLAKFLKPLGVSVHYNNGSDGVGEEVPLN